MCFKEIDIIDNLTSIFEKKEWSLDEDPRNERSRFNRFISRFSLFQAEHQSLLLELTDRFEIIEPDSYPIALHEAFEKISNSTISNAKSIFLIPIKPYGTNSSIVFWHTFQDWSATQDFTYSGKMRFKKDYSFLDKPTTFYDCLFVFIDDYIGTGETIITEIDQFLYNFFPNGVTKENICIICIAGQEDGIKNLTDNDIKCYVQTVFKKGISDYYTDPDLETKRNFMKEIERKLKIEKINRFGRKESEALVSFSSKPPNNTFPVFWHETNKLIAPLPRFHNYGQDD